MAAACAKPSGASRAPHGPAHQIGSALASAGYLAIGDRIRVLGEQLWLTVADVRPRLIGGENLDVAYRLVSVTPTGTRELVVPHSLIVFDPPGTDLAAEASRVTRDELKNADSEAGEAEPAAQTGDEKSAPAGTAEAADVPVVVSEIAWKELSPGLKRSDDWRFAVQEHDINGATWFSASDLLTGEEVTRFANEVTAIEWCRARGYAPTLKWEGFGPVQVARSAEGVPFSVYSSTAGHFIGTDARFAHRSGMRDSPWFEDAESAKRWCEVRACCALEPAAGRDPKLRFQPPIPF